MAEHEGGGQSYTLASGKEQEQARAAENCLNLKSIVHKNHIQ